MWACEKEVYKQYGTCSDDGALGTQRAKTQNHVGVDMSCAKRFIRFHRYLRRFDRNSKMHKTTEP